MILAAAMSPETGTLIRFILVVVVSMIVVVISTRIFGIMGLVVSIALISLLSAAAAIIYASRS